MNKNLKVLVSTLLLSISLASSIPASAATIPTTKPSSTITPAWISEDQPGEGYYSKLWCTGYHVKYYITGADGKPSTFQAGSLDVGDTVEDVTVRGNYAYWYDRSGEGVNEYAINIKYLSTVRV